MRVRYVLRSSPAPPCYARQPSHRTPSHTRPISVRFLDNFSAGTRGATSAEYFLKAGYAVIFMHRQFSLQPFSRHYSHSTNPFLDLLEIHEDPNDPLKKQITVAPPRREELLEVLAAYKDVHDRGMIHTLTFVTVNDYLWLLRAVSKELAGMGRAVLYYLAAAVSAFFLPTQKMVSDMTARLRPADCIPVRSQDPIRQG